MTNDPVMGGVSHSSLSAGRSSAIFAGRCDVVPFLRAPGFCKMSTHGGAFADVSAFFEGGALHLSLRSDTPAYAGFKAAFWASHMDRLPGQRHGTPAFKADFAAPRPPAGHFATVRLPWTSFSAGTSEYTGRCDTTDPTGLTHHCCGAAHPELCPQRQHLAAIEGLAIWAEGVEGDFKLELRSIAAGP